MTIPPIQPGQCAVCRFAECGAGFVAGAVAKRKFEAVTWTCREDIPLAAEVHHMPADKLSLIERRALAEAGDHAGSYLDAIGKTDLADLTKEEWEEFLAAFLDGWGVSMRDQLKAGAAPF